MYVDCHAHLDHVRFKDDLDKVINNCKKHDVTVVASGINKTSNRNVLDIAKKYPDVVKVSLGMFPLDGIGYQADESYLGRKPEKFRN